MLVDGEDLFIKYQFETKLSSTMVWIRLFNQNIKSLSTKSLSVKSHVSLYLASVYLLLNGFHRSQS